MLGILRTLLPLLAGTALLLVWVVVILIVVVRWAVSQFQAERAAVAVVTLLAFFLLPAGAGLLGHLFFKQEPAPQKETGTLAVLSELMDRLVEGSPEEEDAPEDASSDAASPEDAAQQP